MRERVLHLNDVKSLLQAGPVQFIVANLGEPLRWIPENARFAFWKAEARFHIVEHPENLIDIEAYPEEYACVASEWVAEESTSSPIVLLEQHH